MTEADFFAKVRSQKPVIFSDTATDEERSIDGAWISTAAEEGHPVCISCGKIAGLLVLDSMRISANFQLVSCELSEFSARYTAFDRWFRIEQCSFSGSCHLRGARFQSGVWFRGSRVSGNLDLGYVSIETDLDMDGLDCAQRFYAVGAFVGKNLHCRSSTFRKDVQLALCTVKGQVDAFKSTFFGEVIAVDSRLGGLIAVEATFLSTDGQEVLFDRLVVDSGVNFSRVKFAGPTSFGAAVSRGQLIFEGASFDSDCRFEGVEANDAFFRAVRFNGTTSFIGAHLFSADFSDSTFFGDASFNDLRIDIALSLAGTTFLGRAVFDRAHIGESLRASATTRPVAFGGPLTGFAGVTVGSQAVFSGATFSGGVAFESAEFGELFLEQCAFQKIASFVTMRCKGDASFINVTFDRAEFHAAQTGGNFGFKGCTFSKPADLSYIASQGNLVFSECKFCSETIVKNSRVRGELDFSIEYSNRGLKS